MGSTLKRKFSSERTEFKGYSRESLYLLLESIADINNTTGLNALLSASMEAACLVMNAEASSLMLLDRDSADLYIDYPPKGLVRGAVRKKRIPKKAGLAAWVTEHEKPYFSNNAETCKTSWKAAEDFRVRNIICVPLTDKKGRVIGVLQALNRKLNKHFVAYDVPVFQTLASHISNAITKIREKEDLQNKLNESEVLFTEIHHRIKNNLATISALIEAEETEIDDVKAKQILRNTYSRLQSVTEVHDLLCNKSLIENVELGTYLERLAGKIAEILSDPQRRIDIQVKADPVQIDADKAMICGLILNELLVNVYKHAFKGLSQGYIDIRLVALGESRIKLSIADNGIGFPDDFDLGNANSIGTWVVNVLLRKLGAEIEIDGSDGTNLSIEFLR